jgi:hypothetical protein
MRRTIPALIVVGVALLAIGSAGAALLPLPSSGTQVNSDAAAGINPADPVAVGDPTNADVVGGALTAGKPAVPWAIFEQSRDTESQQNQIFVRSFASGAWTTRGVGTAGGASSASPLFSGSLNFDQTQEAEAPSIDFAGAGRTVPWATWYESNTTFGGKTQIFASRFDNTGDANQNKWIFAGQNRNGAAPPNVPSLNIHTDQNAENPSIAGGSTTGGNPGPWVTWQETGANSPGIGDDQIFVVKPVGPGTTTCPAGTKPAPETATVLGGFCWQQVGVDRLGVDPSLNVDRTRDGVEPDIAFTGTSDAVPWVVWYEQNHSGAGLHDNELVFAAKGVADASADGGFEWDVVGRAGTGFLDTSSGGGGACAASQTAEAGCSLNANTSIDAEDPQVAAGTMTAGTPTVPWVVWDEGAKVFVAHLVGTGAAARFQIANNGQPIANGDRTDITFSGHTPYVTWHTGNGGAIKMGHFVNPNQFVVDNAPVGSGLSDNVRAPISSSCIATPFNGDGSTCQGGAIGTPFFLFTADTDQLFGEAFQTDAPATGAASAITKSGATISATVNPEGGPVRVQFQFGTTTSYTATTAAQTLAPADAATPFSAALSGIGAGTTIHYRAIASTDFGTVVGPDRSFKTLPLSGSASVADKKLSDLRKHGKLKLKLKLDGPGKASISGTTVIVKHHKHHTVSLFKSSKTTFTKAGTETITLTLSRSGKNALKGRGKVTITITIKLTSESNRTSTKHLTVKLK